MYNPKGLIAFLNRIDNDPEGNLIINLFKGDLLGNNLFIDTVEMFGASLYQAVSQIHLGKFLPEDIYYFLDIIFPISC